MGLPVRAPRAGIDSVDSRSGGKDEPPGEDRGLGAHQRDTGSGERPLQPQMRHIGGGKASRFCGLESKVGDAIAPGCPRGGSRAAQRCALAWIGKIGLLGNGCPPQPSGHCGALRRCQHRTLLPHGSGCEYFLNRGAGLPLQHLAIGHASRPAVVARGAVLLVNLRAGIRGRLAAQCQRKQKRKRCNEFLHAANIHEIASENTEVSDGAKALALLRLVREPDHERAEFLRLQSPQ